MALTQDPANLITDPLALRFMTGEQMGYMPEAQYLTPSEYGAFRTLPGPQGHNYLNQDPGFLQSLFIRSRGSLGFLPTYTFNTYNPAVNQQQYMYHMRARSDDSLMAGAGVGADMMASMGVGMLLGGVPGLAAGMLMPDISKPFLDRIRDMRGIQNMSMSKIVGGADMNQITGMGFNAESARSLDSFLRASSAGDALLKQGDWRKLLQLGIEHGQFDYAGSADQYKDALKKLRKSITTVMEVAGSTDFKDIMKEYKRMRTMGANLSEYANIMRKEDMYGRITGLSHADMVNTYGQQGALIYQQAGLTGYQGSLQAMHNAASITLMQRTGLLTPSALSRYGGISGMAQTMTQQDAVAQNRIADFMLPYFMKADASGLDDSASLTDLLNSNAPLGMLARAAGSKTRTLEQRMRFDHNRGDLLQQLQERYGQENITAVLALRTGHQAHLKGLDALEFGYRQLGYDPNVAYLKAKNFTSSDFREQEERELQLARRKQRDEDAVANSPFRKLALTLDKTFTRLGENIFGGLVDWHAKRTERKANHDNDLYDAGAGLGNSEAYAKALRKSGIGWEYTGIDAPTGPVPHPVADLAELAAPAVQAASAGDIARLGWDKKNGTTYGMFQWDANQTSNFAKWLKTQGDEGKAYWDKISANGGIQNFGSLEEGQNSSLAVAWEEMSGDDKFRELQLKYAKEKIYDSAFASLSPEDQAQIMSSHAAQKAFFMDVMQGNLEKKAGGGGIAYSELGKYTVKFESGGRGIDAIGYDPSGGTSYGKYQFSTTHVENKVPVDGGSYHGFLKFMENKGGEAAAIAKRLKSAGPLNTKGRSGAAIEAYRREARANPELMERLQHEYVVKSHYKPAFNNLQSESLKKMIASDRGLQELLWSAAIQHGPGGKGSKGQGAARIFNKVYREGMTRDEVIRAVMAERRTRFSTLKTEDPKSWAGVQNRLTEEEKVLLGISAQTTRWSSPTLEALNAGNGSLSKEQISQLLQPLRQNANGNSKTLAALDIVEKNLNRDRVGDIYRQGVDEREKSGSRAAKEKFDAEVQDAVQKINGEVYDAHLQLQQAWSAENSTDIGHLDRILNRFDSGKDVKNGRVDYAGIADIIEGETGAPLSLEQKKRLISELKARGDYDTLASLRTEAKAQKYVKSILQKSDLGLSDSALGKISQNTVLQGAMISSGLHALPEDKAKAIRTDFESRAANAEIDRHKYSQEQMEEMLKEDEEKAFSLVLPGVEDLGGDYKNSRKWLYDKTFHGSGSTPAALNLTRLAVLKKLAMDPSDKGAYARRFREEAVKYEFSDDWINRQLENVNDLSYEDVKGNELFDSLQAGDMSHIGRVSEGVYQKMRKSSRRDELMLGRYDQNLPNKNSILVTPLARIVAERQMASASELARRIDKNMTAQDLLTPAGIAKAHRLVVAGGLGAKEDIRMVEAAWKKHKEGKKLLYSDFSIYRPGRLSSADEYTRAARNADYSGIELSRQVAVEERQKRTHVTPEAEKKGASAQSGAQEGGMLKDSTVAKLNTVLEGLKGILERWEAARAFAPGRGG